VECVIKIVNICVCKGHNSMTLTFVQWNDSIDGVLIRFLARYQPVELDLLRGART
jgi:hypothetical protein